MKFITYNVWHGLGGSGFLRFNELERPGRKNERLELQAGELASLQPDLLFLQEVNPVGSGARFYADKLGMAEVHQVDQAGIEIFGWGVPANLKTGLCLLARPSFKPRKIAGLKLSGDRLGFLSERLSFQLREFRYALFARVWTEDTTILTVNLHLHHGPRLTNEADDRLEDLVDAGRVPRELAEKTRVEMLISVGRRKREIEKILEQVHRLRLDGEEVVLAGDFNSWGEDLDPFERDGFVNVTAPRVREPTWDLPNNLENHKLSRLLVSPYPDYGNADLLEFIRLTIDEPRMLDHVLMSEGLAARVKSARRVFDKPRDGLLGSDHFGLEVITG